MAVLLALNRYTELIQGPLSPDTPPLTDVQWRGIEDDIEQLALGALAKARSEPMLLLGIAKVLCFIDRGYLKLAATLTEEAFEASTAFAAAFTMKRSLWPAKGRSTARSISTIGRSSSPRRGPSFISIS